MTPEFIIEFAKGYYDDFDDIHAHAYAWADCRTCSKRFSGCGIYSGDDALIVPKIIAVFAGLLFFAPWMLAQFTEYTRRIIENIPLYIR